MLRIAVLFLSLSAFAQDRFIAIIDGAPAWVELGGGIVIQKTSAGRYLLRLNVPVNPPGPFTFRLTRLRNGNYTPCGGKIEWNRVGMYAWNGDYSVTSTGEIVAPWPDSDMVVCITNTPPPIRVP